jgi:dihydroorotase
MPYSSPGAGPYTSEAGFIKRDIELTEKTEARIHISHVSLAKSVEIIANAKKRGVKVTAEATPHHLLLTDRMAKEIGQNAKVNPPLRSEEDVLAIREGLANGTIDIIASDHAPHSPEEKRRHWDQAPFGIIDLDRKWKVDSNRFYSKGRNCPFNGWELHGKAILTIVGGRIVAEDGVVK